MKSSCPGTSSRLWGWGQGEIGDRITVPFFQAVEDGGLGWNRSRNLPLPVLARIPKTTIEKGIYSAMVSKAFTEEIIPEGAHKYRVYFRIAGPERMTTDAIEAQIKEIGEEYKLNATDIVDNGEYLNANYVGPGNVQRYGRADGYNRPGGHHYDLPASITCP